MPEWPDWTGETCAIVASGPSTKREEVEKLKGRLRVIAIKKNVEIAPFADAVYGCDEPWWRSVRGLPDYHGLKVAYGPRAAAAYGLTKVDIEVKADRLLWDEVGLVGSGGNSGFHVLNLAAQWGVTRFLLIGFDCQSRSGVHWYGRNSWHAANNPHEHNFRRWREAFGNAADDLKERGVEVVNASPLSDLKCFPKRGVDETLEAWGL